ncbi:flagellar hook-associated protein FlgK [Methylorubrum extorquens]|uniref:flagellar hook-associated protein FlgK n=1 Tax=Methylorubrum extorquens TaxID=408 RepID=UPI00015907A6|nr:flagellar hook-associated protein FlgK [Methylorubrum extorquens]ABY29356.1 flagellar hook-associated protein FlgK [Methylorubrum extorquens PA1]KQP89444.1 flagellar biosynthesis protein FlgK [Methylobacterium sp. Leaf119]WIU40696.1 flagellar hook-associated protein FlgK [Methylorubrum extorquens]
MALDAFSTATAGLRVTQAQIGVVSQNIANVGTAGYVRRTLAPITSGSGNAGVATGTVARALDAAALKQLRAESSGAAYTSLMSKTRTQLDTLYGRPGDASALDGVFNNFTLSLQTLAANPTSTAARATVLSAANDLATRIGSAANGVQALRSGLESQLATDTEKASGLLAQLAKLNTRIVATASGDASRPELEDQRDQALTSLSGLIDINAVPQSDGSVSVLTSSGVTLLDRSNAASLRFDARGTLSANALYASDPSQSGVGTIVASTPGGGKIDLLGSGAIRSGSIAAAIELRDTVLPQAQRQLDDLAAGLSRAMSDRLATGTVPTDGTTGGFDIDLTGLSAGNAITLTVQDGSGTQRNLILMPSYQNPPPAIPAGATDDANATVIPFTIRRPDAVPARTADEVRNAITAALGGGYTVSSVPGGEAGAMRILSSGGATLVAASASVTQVTAAGDIKGSATQIPLFVDGASAALYTGSFDGGSQLTGFAQRIAVNPAVVGSAASLVGVTGTGAASGIGDGTRPQALFTALTSTQRLFSSSSGISGIDAPTRSSVADFVQGVISVQGAAAAAAQDLDEGQSIALSTAQGRFASASGVNIDEEMSNLIALQQAYAANARVLTAARDMIDTLLRI